MNNDILEFYSTINKNNFSYLYRFFLFLVFLIVLLIFPRNIPFLANIILSVIFFILAISYLFLSKNIELVRIDRNSKIIQIYYFNFFSVSYFTINFKDLKYEYSSEMSYRSSKKWVLKIYINNKKISISTDVDGYSKEILDDIVYQFDLIKKGA